MTELEALLPIPAGPDASLPSVMERLAEIPEGEIWLQKQKSARTRRVYRLDVRHFMRTLDVTAQSELRQVDHRAAIASERHMREVEPRLPRAEPSAWRRRLEHVGCTLPASIIRTPVRSAIGEVIAV
jgi:transglutaminase-like putative cysteine protease